MARPFGFVGRAIFGRVGGPTTGDFLITKASNHPSPYKVSVVPGLPRFHCDSYARAVELSDSLASHRHVDLWYVDEDTSYALVTSHRHHRLGPLRFLRGA